MESTLTLKKDAKPEQATPVEVLETINIDLAPTHGLALNIGGRQFVHGMSYTLPVGVVWTLKEAMNRGWAHENSLQDRTNYSKNKPGRSGRTVI